MATWEQIRERYGEVLNLTMDNLFQDLKVGYMLTEMSLSYNNLQDFHRAFAEHFGRAWGKEEQFKVDLAEHYYTLAGMTPDNLKICMRLANDTGN